MSIFSVVGASVLSLGACHKGGSASKDDLALVPRDAQMVFGINLSRMRGTAMWKKIIDLGMGNDRAKKDYEEFAANCIDLNGNAGPESMFIALPNNTSGAKDFDVVIRLKDAVDEARTSKCFTYMATKSNDTITTVDYGGKKLYTSARDKTTASLLDGKTIVAGSDAWVKKTIDIVAGKEPASAKQNEELVALVKSAKTSEAVWGAAIVPQSARDSFKNDPKMAPMSSMKSVVGMMDFASGLVVDLNMETGSAADATAINTQVQDQLANLKKMPQVMMLGVASWLDGIKTDSKGQTFHVGLNYTQPQVDDMVARIQGLVRSFAGGLGGMGGGMGSGAPMGGPPPGMGGNPAMV
ncbi:MAG: hypothetical protein ABI321_14125, partial [Polyangia bacterium]